MSAVTATGLVRHFGRITALQNVSLDIPSGSICGLIGPNGAGKTTLFRVLCGLDEPDEGVRAIDGVDVGLRPHEARSRFGYVPDYAALYDGMTVRELVDFFAHAQGIPEGRRSEAVEASLGRTGLQPVADRAANTLSKGMTQRACVACALVHDPAVIFMDEPASGLDPRARIEFRDLIKELRTAGKTVFISSHILSELADMVDRVIILERGVVKAAGPVETALLGGGESRLQVRLEVSDNWEAALASVRQLPGVTLIASQSPWVTVALERHAGVETSVPWLIRELVDRGVKLQAVIPVRPNLESLFMTVTKGELQ